MELNLLIHDHGLLSIYLELLDFLHHYFVVLNIKVIYMILDLHQSICFWTVVKGVVLQKFTANIWKYNWFVFQVKKKKKKTTQHKFTLLILNCTYSTVMLIIYILLYNISLELFQLAKYNCYFLKFCNLAELTN